MAPINITFPIGKGGTEYNVQDACSPDVKACESTFNDQLRALGVQTSQVEYTPQYHYEELPKQDDVVEA